MAAESSEVNFITGSVASKHSCLRSEDARPMDPEAKLGVGAPIKIDLGPDVAHRRRSSF